jgi:hypothetical protein
MINEQRKQQITDRLMQERTLRRQMIASGQPAAYIDQDIIHYPAVGPQEAFHTLTRSSLDYSDTSPRKTSLDPLKPLDNASSSNQH